MNAIFRVCLSETGRPCLSLTSVFADEYSPEIKYLSGSFSCFCVLLQQKARKWCDEFRDSEGCRLRL